MAPDIVQIPFAKHLITGRSGNSEDRGLPTSAPAGLQARMLALTASQRSAIEVFFFLAYAVAPYRCTVLCAQDFVAAENSIQMVQGPPGGTHFHTAFGL